LPALIYLWIRYIHIEPTFKNKIVKGCIGLGLFIFPLFFIVFIFYLGDFQLSKFITGSLNKSHFLPLKGVSKSIYVAYNLFSLPHLLDIINELLLISPLFFAGILIIIVWWRKLLSLLDPQWIFLTVASIFYLFLLTGFNPQIGTSRDWDLFAPLAIPLTLLTLKSVFLVKQHLNKIELIVMNLFLLVHIFSWAGVNANDKWSMNRFVAMTSDPKWSSFAKANAFDELRRFYLNKDQSDIALQYAKQAALEVGSARHFYNWANRLFHLNRFEEAVDVYQKVIELDASVYDAYINYSTALFRTGRLSEALNVYKAAQQQFNIPELYYSYATLFAEEKLFLEAAQSVASALELNPDYLEALLLLAYLYQKVNRFDEAEKVYQVILNKYPNNQAANINYGAVLFSTGKYQEALEFYSSIQEEFKTSNFYYNLGIIYEALKRYDDAIEAVNKALELKPDYLEASEVLYKLNKEIDRQNNK